ncbi:MAG: porin [Burkholderiales bacterium]
MNFKKRGAALAVSAAFSTPFAASADSGNVTIYGWINENVEFVETDDATSAASLPTNWALRSGGGASAGGQSPVGINRDFRSQFGGNASEIGFRGTEDIGNGIKVNFQCNNGFLPDGEFSNQFNGSQGIFGWCGRNSKIGIAGPWGEIMYSSWLTPYIEMNEGLVDPFYDADASGSRTLFGGFGHDNGLSYYIPGLQGLHQDAFQFNRRQEGFVQYWTPNWNGFTARVGYTPNAAKDRFGDSGLSDFDPYIFSLAANYQWGPGWIGFGYENHNDWSADLMLPAAGGGTAVGGTDGSSDEAWTIHGGWTFDMGSGSSLKLAAIYENTNWEFDRNSALGGFGLGTAIPFEELEKDVWAASAQYTTGQWRIMGHYQETGDLDCDDNLDFSGVGAGTGSCEDDETGAQAWTVGAGYDLSKRTALYAAWTHIDNDDNGAYDIVISGPGTSIGGEADSMQLRIHHAF